MDMNKKLNLIYLIATASTIFVVFSILEIGSNSLVKEFTGSYPEEVQASGKVVEVDITARVSEVELIDGQNLRVWTYNGQIPGPEIRVNLGETLRINFTNKLPQPTTIHFHGIRVPNEMDGVPGITQEPIQPGDSFKYEFTPKDAGTFWYHSHVRSSEQVERGLYGTIVVEDPSEPKYNQDRVIVLDDWRIDDTGQINENFNTPHDLMHDGRWGNLITVNGVVDYELQANPGERIRLRFVNSSNARVYKLDFGNLEAKGFAVDGMLSKEVFDAQGFELSPGNRLDVDITIPMASTYESYYIKDSFTRRNNNLFKIAPSEEITNISDFETPTANIFPEWNGADKEEIDHELVLDARRGGEYGIEWTINEKAFPDYAPIKLKKGEFNKLRFTNASTRLHPMHLHGQFFKILARNGNHVQEPYWRDTVLIHPRESVDIGLVPLDTGKWANHCHILEHAEAGMMNIIEVI